MRKALVVGIDYYQHASRLFGCVNDAYSLKSVLDRNSDGTVNFAVKLLTCTNSTDPVTRAHLRESISALFYDDSDIALFYFAGHGSLDATGGFILATDSQSGDAGIALHDIHAFANNSPAKNKVIILDSCHAGIVATTPLTPSVANLNDGLTILTASTAEQYASEEDGSGVFSGLLVDALSGAAANLVGSITPGSVYAHIDQSLGPWEQRPVFKTNVKRFISLRHVDPPIALDELRMIKDLFPSPGFEFPLDPTFEPERNSGDGLPPPIAENTARFAVLQKLNRVNLVVPVNASHMWHAAVRSTSCKLTALGEHYRRLAIKERI